METVIPVTAVLAVLGVGSCSIVIWSVTTARWVHRHELDTRAELHQRDYIVLTSERDGWRNVTLDLKEKLEKAAAINAEALKANALAVAIIHEMRKNEGTSRTGQTAETSGDNGR